MTLPTLGRFVIPEVVASHFHIHEGERVADFGAGSGFYIPVLSAAVGSTGRVFACEIQRPLVEKLGSFARMKGLENVDPLWCDLEAPRGIKLADESLDAAILVNTLFQLENKDISIIEMARTLKRGGVMHVIDWSESFGGLGPALTSVVTKEAAIALFESHGFQFEREYPAGEHHYGLAFRVL